MLSPAASPPLEEKSGLLGNILWETFVFLGSAELTASLLWRAEARLMDSVASPLVAIG